MARLSVSLPDSTFAALGVRAGVERRSVSAMAALLLEDALTIDPAKAKAAVDLKGAISRGDKGPVSRLMEGR